MRLQGRENSRLVGLARALFLTAGLTALGHLGFPILPTHCIWTCPWRFVPAEIPCTNARPNLPNG